MPHTAISERAVWHPIVQPNSHSTPKVRRQSIDDLDRAIVGLSHKMNADNYKLLVLIRQFDERAGWLQWGLNSCTDWLHWRCDLSRPAAREKVRVAHALKSLPKVSAAFATGRLSYSKVRAITRVAIPENEADLIDLARNMTASHVEQHCRQRTNASETSKDGAARAHAQRGLRSWRNESRGVVTIKIELPIADGLLFEKAIDKACADQDGSRNAPDDSTSWKALQADAAMAMARAYLAGFPGASTPSCASAEAPTSTNSPTASTADHYQVMVHVDHAALSGNDGQSEMPIDTVKRLCCDGNIVPIVENSDREPLSVGRKQRVVTTAIRRALWSRDRGCAFPGCSHTRFVDAHHIKHWADGGETKVENLVLLCTSHHQLVHEGGYEIQCDHEGKRCFKRPDGRAVPRCGYHVDDWRDDYSNNDESIHVREPAAIYKLRTTT